MALTKPKLSQNIDTDISVFSDPILVLHQGSTQPDIDVGFLMNRSNGLTANAAVIWQESSRSFVHILTNSSGVTDSNLVVQSYANVSVGNVLLINNAGIYVDGTLGSSGQVLQSDGSKTYWGAPGGFTGGAVPNQTTFASNLVVSNTTPSTSNVTGALVVLGGVGIAGNVYANVFYTADGIRWAGNGAVFASGGGGGTGTTYTANTAPPTSGNVAGDMWYNTNTDILYEYLNDGTSNYWVDVQSLGQTGNITTISDATLAGNIVVSLNDTISIGGATGYVRNIFANTIVANTQTVSGNIVAAATTSSISTTTGALVVAGGVGIAGNLYIGATADQSILLNSYPEWAANAARQTTRLFSSSTAPSSPILGDQWYDTSTDIIFNYINDGVAFYWVDVSTQTANANAAVTGTVATIFGNGTFYSSVTVNINNNAIAIANGGSNGIGNIGQSGRAFDTIFAKSTSALYADLAEIYRTDNNYDSGTVVVFGGDKEITVSNISHDSRVAGVISDNPAYIMNSEANGLPVALTGRVPCFVQGPVSKGDILVTSNIAGVAQKLIKTHYQVGCVIGKSLEEILTDQVQKIEIAVGRF